VSDTPGSQPAIKQSPSPIPPTLTHLVDTAQLQAIQRQLEEARNALTAEHNARVAAETHASKLKQEMQLLQGKYIEEQKLRMWLSSEKTKLEKRLSRIR